MQVKSKMGLAVLMLVLAVLFALSAFAQAGLSISRSSGTAPAGGRENIGTYILREQDGFIAVYGADSANTPLELTDIEVSTLRRVDQDMLEQGISAKSRDELLTLLEDLGS